MIVKITVIIPIFNKEKFIVQCIDSLLCQTFNEFEMILVNDGSTDGSGKICNEYVQKDSRIKVIHKKNGGVSSARNAGIKEAKGKYITFVDADDKVKPSFLQDFNAEENEADFFVQGYINWNDKNNYKKVEIIETDAYYTDLSKIIESLEIEYFVLEAPWAKLFSNKILSYYQHKFNESLSKSEDHLFIIQYLQFINSIFLCSAANYCYRKYSNKNSLSHKYTEHNKLHLYAILVYNARLQVIEKHKLGQRYQRFIQNVYSDLLNKSLIKLFNKQEQISKQDKVRFINKYLHEISVLSKNNSIKTVKKGFLINVIWKSGVPFKLKILEKILDQK